MTAINPCRYCGGHGQVRFEYESPEACNPIKYVQCSKCRRKTIETYDYYGALEAWNRGEVE